MTQHLINIFKRDLGRLKREIELYEDESQLWTTKGEITNTAGNLVLHLCGNLQHFIGARLGNTGYIREREKEFSEKNIPRKKLLELIDHTQSVVNTTLEKLSEEDLENDYEIPNWKEKITVGFWLIHLTTHLNYHLGQINYHRRMLSA